MIKINKKILITGATGFIGSNLLKKLIDNNFNNISIIVRENSNFSRIENLITNIDIHKCSLNDLTELDYIISKIKPDIIYHIAANGTSGGKDKINFDELYDSNYLGTYNLLNICKKYGFEYFINSGSSSEYGKKDLPMCENDFLEPNNDYGFTKSLSTLYCKYIGESKKLPIYNFRIFSAYGYNEDSRRLIPTIISNYSLGISPNLSNPNSVRDYIFIDDIIYCYLNIDKFKGDYGGIYNLGSGIQYSIDEVVKIIKKIINSKIEPIYGKIKSTQNEPKSWVSNNHKMLKTFDLKIHSLEEGLKKLLNK